MRLGVCLVVYVFVVLGVVLPALTVLLIFNSTDLFAVCFICLLLNWYTLYCVVCWFVSIYFRCNLLFNLCFWSVWLLWVWVDVCLLFDYLVGLYLCCWLYYLLTGLLVIGLREFLFVWWDLGFSFVVYLWCG